MAEHSSDAHHTAHGTSHHVRSVILNQDNLTPEGSERPETRLEMLERTSSIWFVFHFLIPSRIKLSIARFFALPLTNKKLETLNPHNYNWQPLVPSEKLTKWSYQRCLFTVLTRALSAKTESSYGSSFNYYWHEVSRVLCEDLLSTLRSPGPCVKN